MFLLDQNLTKGDSFAVFVEIGTAYGGLSEYLLQRLPSLMVISIDPFLPGYDPGDVMSQFYSKLQREFALQGNTSESGSEVWARAMRYSFRDFGSRYCLKHGLSSDVAAEFRNVRRVKGSVDAIFIDGDHTFAGVETDIVSWQPIVREGGLLIFNDYDASPGSTFFQGVRNNVDALAIMTSQPISYIGHLSHTNVVLKNVHFTAET